MPQTNNSFDEKVFFLFLNSSLRFSTPSGYLPRITLNEILDKTAESPVCFSIDFDKNLVAKQSNLQCEQLLLTHSGAKTYYDNLSSERISRLNTQMNKIFARQLENILRKLPFFSETEEGQAKRAKILTCIREVLNVLQEKSSIIHYGNQQAIQNAMDNVFSCVKDFVENGLHIISMDEFESLIEEKKEIQKEIKERLSLKAVEAPVGFLDIDKLKKFKGLTKLRLDISQLLKKISEFGIAYRSKQEVFNLISVGPRDEEKKALFFFHEEKIFSLIHFLKKNNCFLPGKLAIFANQLVPDDVLKDVVFRWFEEDERNMAAFLEKKNVITRLSDEFLAITGSFVHKLNGVGRLFARYQALSDFINEDNYWWFSCCPGFRKYVEAFASESSELYEKDYAKPVLEELGEIESLFKSTSWQALFLSRDNIDSITENKSFQQYSRLIEEWKSTLRLYYSRLDLLKELNPVYDLSLMQTAWDSLLKSFSLDADAAIKNKLLNELDSLIQEELLDLIMHNNLTQITLWQLRENFLLTLLAQLNDYSRMDVSIMSPEGLNAIERAGCIFSNVAVKVFGDVAKRKWIENAYAYKKQQEESKEVTESSLKVFARAGSAKNLHANEKSDRLRANTVEGSSPLSQRNSYKPTFISASRSVSETNINVTYRSQSGPPQ